eukprot:gene1030-813_t
MTTLMHAVPGIRKRKRGDTEADVANSVVIDTPAEHIIDVDVYQQIFSKPGFSLRSGGFLRNVLETRRDDLLKVLLRHPKFTADCYTREFKALGNCTLLAFCYQKKLPGALEIVLKDRRCNVIQKDNSGLTVLHFVDVFDIQDLNENFRCIDFICRKIENEIRRAMDVSYLNLPEDMQREVLGFFEVPDLGIFKREIFERIVEMPPVNPYQFGNTFDPNIPEEDRSVDHLVDDFRAARSSFNATNIFSMKNRALYEYIAAKLEKLEELLTSLKTIQEEKKTEQ